jgi:hypothetical protein
MSLNCSELHKVWKILEKLRSNFMKDNNSVSIVIDYLRSINNYKKNHVLIRQFYEDNKLKSFYEICQEVERWKIDEDLIILLIFNENDNQFSYYELSNFSQIPNKDVINTLYNFGIKCVVYIKDQEQEMIEYTIGFEKLKEIEEKFSDIYDNLKDLDLMLS